MDFKFKQYYIIILLCVSLNSIAQNVEQFYMKSGSVIEGYIAEQRPGKFITLQASQATIVVNSDSLQSRIVERIPVESLSKEWRDWAELNDKFVIVEDQKLLELTTLKFENCVYPKVFLIEKGSLIKFIDVSSNTYTFKWGDMYRTVKKRRPDNLLSGLKEVLVLWDGTNVEGQIIEQFPGRDLKIMTVQGDVLSYKFAQVKQIITEKLNDKLSLWSQIQFLDKIQLKDDGSFLEGFISARALSKELVIELGNGQSRTISLNDIESYYKIPNKRYVAVYDNKLKEGEILLNGEPAYFEKLENQDQYLLLGEIVSAQLPVGDTVSVEANLKDNDTPIVLVRAHWENITQMEGKKRRTVSMPVVTFQDLFQSHLPLVREITPLGNIKISFELKEEGDYVLHIKGIEGYIIINVVNKNAIAVNK